MKTEIILHGCAPIPLAHYLKALGVLRLIAESERGDESTSVRWANNHLVLKSRFDRDALVEFFYSDYTPTPLIVPWSGGDFFAVNRAEPASKFGKPPTSSRVIEAVLTTEGARLSNYRRVLRETFLAMDRAGVKTKKDIEGSGGPQRRLKSELLKSLRNFLPDEAVAWLDATSIIEPEAVAFNALLGGGGGSDGNSHFSDNFMQSLWMTLPEFDAQRPIGIRAIGRGVMFDSRAALIESLFNEQSAGTKIPDLSPVLFDSTRVGGPNQTSGFEAKSGSNPWDFILMLEGAVLFAGAIGRKLDDHREPSARFPFLFQSSPVGIGSTFLGESAGRELWLPLWSNASTVSEIRSLLSEGRVEKHGRMARRGTDAFVAAAQLGFDRGISSFQRIGLFKGRIGGDNYFTAIDQGLIVPRRNQSVDLLRETDEWVTRLVSTAKSDTCPASVKASSVALERRISALAVTNRDSSDYLLSVLIALGTAERTLAKSLKWTKDAYLSPLSGLSRGWIDQADNGSPEFRLACALASMCARLGDKTLCLRQHLEPVTIGTWTKWSDTPGNDVVWHEGEFAAVLNDILARRMIRVEKSGARGWPNWSPRPARLDDITQFIEGRTDDTLLADLLWGLSLLDWERIVREERAARRDGDDKWEPGKAFADEEHRAVPSSLYALLRLCFREKFAEYQAIPLVPSIHARAAAGQGQTASEIAARRLRGSGFLPLVDRIAVGGKPARRTAAALLFPISRCDFRLLEKNILQEPETKIHEPRKS